MDALDIVDYGKTGDAELIDILEIYKIDDITIFYSKRYNEYTFDNIYGIKKEDMHFKEIPFSYTIVKELLRR